jgi:hypothetical protein
MLQAGTKQQSYIAGGAHLLFLSGGAPLSFLASGVAEIFCSAMGQSRVRSGAVGGDFLWWMRLSVGYGVTILFFCVCEWSQVDTCREMEAGDPFTIMVYFCDNKITDKVNCRKIMI